MNEGKEARGNCQIKIVRLGRKSLDQVIHRRKKYVMTVSS